MTDNDQEYDVRQSDEFKRKSNVEEQEGTREGNGGHPTPFVGDWRNVKIICSFCLFRLKK